MKDAPRCEQRDILTRHETNDLREVFGFSAEGQIISPVLQRRSVGLSADLIALPCSMIASCAAQKKSLGL